MQNLKFLKIFKKLLRPIRYYRTGKRYLENPYYLEAVEKSKIESQKEPSRTEVINYLIGQFGRKTTYLEIGVRNPDHNFNSIRADLKYSVDPGVEFEENPVDFLLTSDAFFEQLEEGTILSPDIRFDVIFLDGLHLAEQVDRDISNAMRFIHDDGFIVIHDCNPPTEWHTRTTYRYFYSPARGNWNGTTWKAFMKWRSNKDVFSCCIDTNWGMGIISKTRRVGSSLNARNPFFEFDVFDENRIDHLNLVSFEKFKEMLR